MAEDRNELFAGEERGSGYAPPVLDLAASAFLIVLSVIVIVESIALKRPEGWATAPGLLPLATAASLLVMSLVLAWSAVKRRRAGIAGRPVEDVGDRGRTILLIAIVACYLLALEFAGFEHEFRLMGMWVGIGSFELVSTIVLTAVLAIFWKGPIWACVAISAGWVFLLAGVFRYLFHIPLPG